MKGQSCKYAPILCQEVADCKGCWIYTEKKGDKTTIVINKREVVTVK